MSGHEIDGPGLKFEQLTKTIIGCAIDVSNELGAGFVESVYTRALLLALQQKGLAARLRHPVEVRFRGQIVGEFYADMLVEEKVILELKAAKAIAPEHQAQIVNYLHASGLEVGLLLNFGTPKLEFQRFTRNHRRPPTNHPGIET